MRNIISYMFLILLLQLLGISHTFADCIRSIALHCVDEISQDYRSPSNGYCDGTNSKEELVEVWWSSVGIQITPNDWDSIIIPDIEHSAQFVNNPSLSLQDPLFVYADDATPWTNGENWSDTWAVCAVFETTGFHGNSAIGPSVINNLEDINAWDTATRNSVPESTWRIVGVADINVGLTSFYGWTKPMSRLCLIEKWVIDAEHGEKIFLHEWGHTYEPYYPPKTENESGMYRWPSEIVGSLPEGYHYGEYRILQQQYAQPYFSWNVMHYNQYCGKDGDWNWRHEKYPWNSLQWYLSFRWDENLEPEDD